MATRNNPAIQSGSLTDVNLMPEDSFTRDKAFIHFRYTDEYKGEFGFDWFREYDGITKIHTTVGNVDVIDYENSLKYVYNPNSSNQAFAGLTPDPNNPSTLSVPTTSAFDQMKKDYEQFIFNRPGSTFRIPYYIPYLNIYPNTVSVGAGDQIPPSTVKLRLIKDIAESASEDIEKFTLEWNASYFSINGSTGTQNSLTFTDTAETDSTFTGTALLEGGDLTITCISEFGSRQYIEVKAHAKNNNARPQLVGKLCVLPNSSAFRKSRKFLIVSVKLGSLPPGTLYNYDKKYLQQYLYHSLVYAKVVECPWELNLSNDTDFKVGGRYYSNDTDYISREVANQRIAAKFFNNPNSRPYKTEYTLVFLMPKNIKDSVTMGHSQLDPFTLAWGSEDIEYKSIVLYPLRDTATSFQSKVALAHEAYHTSGVAHPFFERDSTAVFDMDDTSVPNNKKRIIRRAGGRYIFNNKADTDNLLEYDRKATNFTSWRWQWKLVNQS